MCSVIRGKAGPLVLLASLALPIPAAAQVPQLLQDLNTAPPPEPSSWPSDFVSFGNEALFHAETPQVGRAVFRTDGTTAGTALFLDHEPGPGEFETRIWDLVPFGNGWLFGSEHPQTGPEVWVTDGTTAGTRLLVEIHPGTNHAGPAGFTALGNEVVFAAHGPRDGIEPWITDGTPAGTRELVDLRPGRDGSLPEELHAVNGRVLFTATDGVTGREPWITDGTPGGTLRLADIRPGSASSDPFVLGSAANGDLLLGVRNPPAGGSALWVTDGTPAGTRPLASSLAAARPHTGLVVGNELWFVGYEPTHGDEPWATDGTAAGTRRLFEFSVGMGSAEPRFLGELPGGTVLVRAFDRLYSTDGTAAGTRQLSSIANLYSTDHASLRNSIVLRGVSAAGGDEPWISDGTPAGTHQLADLFPGSRGSVPFSFLAFAGTVLFAARDDTYGAEPWSTDGTPMGTSPLANLAANGPNQTDDSHPEAGVDWFGHIEMLAATPDVEPWQSDGTAGGTSKTIALLQHQAMPQLNENGNPRLHVVGDQLVLLIDDQSVGTQFWVDRGTGPMPGPLFATAPGSRPLLDHLVIGDSAWFSGQQLVHYRNGTTTPVNFGGGGTIPWAFQLTALGQWAIGTAFVQGVDGLWRLDGATPTLLHIYPRFRPEYLVAARDRLFFVADDGAGAGTEIWSTDGTAAGTRVLDLHPGNVWASVRPLAAFGDQLLFQDQDRVLGNSLWLTDGTLQRTVPYDPFPPGVTQGVIDEVVPCGPDRYAFVMDDGTHGREPWLLTGSGASLVADLLPGAESSRARILGATGEEFWIQTALPSAALWRSDGTAVGTQQVLAGESGSTLFCESGGRLYLDHDDGIHGREPFVVRTGASACRVGHGCGDGNRVAWLESEDPVLGQPFTLRGGGGPPGSAGAVLLGVPAATPVVLGSGCVLHLRPAGFTTLLHLTDASLPWSVTLPLPAAPVLDDLQFVVQQASGPATNGLGFELGDALWLTLGMR